METRDFIMLEANIVPYHTLLESDDWTFKYLNEVTNLSRTIRNAKEQNVIREDRAMYSVEPVKLSNLVDINPDKVNKANLNPDEMFPYIDVSSISSDTGIIIEVKTVEGKDLPARARFQVKEGDILLSTVRPERNIVALVPSNCDGCIVNSTLAVLRPKKEVKGELLYFLLRSDWVRKMLTIKARGTAIPTISIKDIKELDLPISKYNLDEMQEEAHYLYSEWLELNELKKPFREVIEDTFIAHDVIFENKAFETQEPIYKTYPYNQLQDRLDVGFYFNETNFNVSWSVELVKLKELIKDVKSGATPVSDKYSEQGVPFIRIKDLDDEGLFIQTEDITYIDVEDAANYSKYAVSKDNVLISKVGTVGKAALVQSDMEGAIINQHLVSIELNGHLLPEFLVYYLKTSWVRQEFERRSGGSAQQFIKVQGIEELPVPLPPINVQEAIIDHIRQKSSNDQVEKLQERINGFLKNVYVN